jgi:ribosome-binding factor A
MKNMGDGRRISRVESEVQRIVSQYLITQLREEIPGIITVSRVKMPADLRLAKVYISILNPKEDMKGVLKKLQYHAADIQRFIGDSLRMRYCPKLAFFEDETTQKVLKVDEILRSLAPPEVKKPEVDEDHDE